jgi:hypothetical protein
VEHACSVTAGSALLRSALACSPCTTTHSGLGIDPATFGVTPLVLAGDGTALAKSVKPDFESAAHERWRDSSARPG